MRKSSFLDYPYYEDKSIEYTDGPAIVRIHLGLSMPKVLSCAGYSKAHVWQAIALKCYDSSWCAMPMLVWSVIIGSKTTRGRIQISTHGINAGISIKFSNGPKTTSYEPIQATSGNLNQAQLYFLTLREWQSGHSKGAGSYRISYYSRKRQLTGNICSGKCLCGWYQLLRRSMSSSLRL